MKKAPFTFETLVTIIGVFIIFIIANKGQESMVYVLLVLGALCALLGAGGLIKGYTKLAKQPPKEGTAPRCLLQIILGGFIFTLGLVEILHLELGQNFWSGVLIVIVIIAILWFIFRNKGIFNK